jgi:hypothetical protein
MEARRLNFRQRSRRVSNKRSMTEELAFSEALVARGSHGIFILFVLTGTRTYVVLVLERSLSLALGLCVSLWKARTCIRIRAHIPVKSNISHLKEKCPKRFYRFVFR